MKPQLAKSPRTRARPQQLQAPADAVLRESPPVSERDALRQVHEIQVYQAELEMQNEELRRAQVGLEASRDRYQELYEFAPVGLLVVDHDSLIHECNATAAHLLGIEHGGLVRKKFNAFVTADSQDAYTRHAQEIFRSGCKVVCELVLRSAAGDRVVVMAESVVVVDDKHGPPSCCLMALSDISMRVAAERMRKESQARLSGIVSTALDGLITTDNENRIILCNAAAERMFGRAAREMTGELLTRLIPELLGADPSGGCDMGTPVGGAPPTAGMVATTIGLRADGTRFPVEASVSAITAGGQQLFTVILRDITDRRRTEKSLELFRALIDRSRDSVEVIDPETGRFLDANAQAFEALDYTREEFLQLTVFDIAPEIDRTTYDRYVRQLRATGAVSFEGKHRRRDGSTFPVEVNFSWVTIEHDYIIAAVRDIGRRKAMEEALRATTQDLEDFFAESPLGLFWVSPAGQVERVNRAGLELLGLPSAEVTGRPAANWFVKPTLAAHLLERLARRETVHDARARLRHQSGATLHVLIDANGLWRGGMAVGSRWFVRDITQRIELQSDVLAIAERERRRLGHDLHDDLCQQLSGIQFLSETLAGILDRSSKEGARRAREIGRLTSEAVGHARDLAHGLSPMTVENDGLVTALRGLAMRTRQVFRRDCRFVCERPVTIADQVVSAHLFHIAQEAVNNAVRHSKARSLRIHLTKKAGHITLSITDDGTGIVERPRRKQGMGMQVMQYRAGMIDAALVVQPRVEGGTEVTCTIGRLV